MKTYYKRWVRRALTCAVILVQVGIAHGASADAGTTARSIRDASGFSGGLIVHSGCGEGELTAALGTDERTVVHGLSFDAVNVAKARARFRSLGLDGRTSAAVFDGAHLPYADGMVNLVVFEDRGGRVEGDEIARVLAPRGVVLVRGELASPSSALASRPCSLSGWRMYRKPVPADTDEWTHYLHGPDNNAVADDTIVGPPHHYQWITGPRFSRSHDHLASVTAMVTAGGRLFSIVDEGSTAFVAAQPRWRLVSRDAFNGIRLWEREVGPWAYHLRDFRSGPADVSRRLVAEGDRVYVTLGYGKPVVALDAATGKTVHTYAGTEGTTEILRYEDMLLLALGEPNESWGAEEAKKTVSEKDYTPPFENYMPPPHVLRIVAVSAASGEPIWCNTEPCTRTLMPSTLAASDGSVFFQNAGAVVCLDAKTGTRRWETPRPTQRQRLAWSTPTVVAYDGIVYSADRGAAKPEGELQWLPSGGFHQYIRNEDAKGELIAFDARTGEPLWNCVAYEGFNAPVDVLIADGLLWTGRYAWGRDPGVTLGRDPRTGEVRRRRAADTETLQHMGHARCHRAKATSRYLVLGRRGIECVDLKTGDIIADFWVRGICQYGVMPANGLIYIPPHSCACSVNDLIKSGFIALAGRERGEGRGSGGEGRGARDEGEQLEKGSAYDSPIRQSAIGIRQSSDWPMYRHDSRRSGVSTERLSQDLREVWRRAVGGRLTPPVVANGVVAVAQRDRHTLHALDAASGETRWTFIAGGRIDSPPTIHRGRVLFGAADGTVTCLRLKDGETVWTFKAAPRDRLIVVNGQLESTWPVSGSVLVVDDAVYFAAGRTSYLDGGMRLYKLDALTGQELQERTLAADEKKRDSGIASGGYLPDILSSDGESLFMRYARFDMELARQKDSVPHLWSSVGFLDANWWHRTYWQVGTSMGSGWGGWPKAGRQVPAGRLLVDDGARVYGYGRNQYDIPGAHVGVDGAGAWGPVGKGESRWTYYRLFGRSLETGVSKPTKQPASPGRKAGGADWSCRVPVVGRAMVLAGDTLFVAGPSDPLTDVPKEPSAVDPLADALESDNGGRLLAVSATDGKTLSDRPLKHPPVFDGMAVANGRLYISTRDGEVVCRGDAE